MCNMNRREEGWEDDEYMKNNNWPITWNGQDWKTKVGTDVEICSTKWHLLERNSMELSSHI